MRDDGVFPDSEVVHAPPVLEQTLVGVGVFASGGLLAIGALSIPGEAGYQGVGPKFNLSLAGLWVKLLKIPRSLSVCGHSDFCNPWRVRHAPEGV